MHLINDMNWFAIPESKCKQLQRNSTFWPFSVSLCTRWLTGVRMFLHMLIYSELINQQQQQKTTRNRIGYDATTKNQRNVPQHTRKLNFLLPE